MGCKYVAAATVVAAAAAAVAKGKAAAFWLCGRLRIVKSGVSLVRLSQAGVKDAKLCQIGSPFLPSIYQFGQAGTLVRKSSTNCFVII